MVREQYESRDTGSLWMRVHGEQGQERAEEDGVAYQRVEKGASADPGVDCFSLVAHAQTPSPAPAAVPCRLGPAQAVTEFCSSHALGFSFLASPARFRISGIRHPALSPPARAAPARSMASKPISSIV
jgi:hypothetical protein